MTRLVKKYAKLQLMESILTREKEEGYGCFYKEVVNGNYSHTGVHVTGHPLLSRV